jgi:hypothetical protein
MRLRHVPKDRENLSLHQGKWASLLQARFKDPASGAGRRWGETCTHADIRMAEVNVVRFGMLRRRIGSQQTNYVGRFVRSAIPRKVVS